MISGHLRYQYLLGKILTLTGLQDLDPGEIEREEAAYVQVLNARNTFNWLQSGDTELKAACSVEESEHRVILREHVILWDLD
jgi:hypothetical protein